MYQFLCFMQSDWLTHVQVNLEYLSYFIFHQIFSFMHHWSKCIVWLSEYSWAAKTAWLWKWGNVTQIFPNFQNCSCSKKYMKDNKHNNLHFAQMCGQVVVLGHYLFLNATVFLALIVCSHKTVCFWEQMMSADKYPNIHDLLYFRAKWRLFICLLACCYCSLQSIILL